MKNIFKKLFSNELTIREKLLNAGFIQDRFGQYNLEKPDGTKITFYKGSEWEVDICLRDGSILTENDIEAEDLLSIYTEI